MSAAIQEGMVGTSAIPAPIRGTKLIEIGIDVFINIRHFVELGGRAGPVHDHSWRVQTVCSAAQPDPTAAVVVEFAAVRQRLQGIATLWDDQLLNNLPVFSALQPTVENALVKLEELTRNALAGLPVELSTMTIWENPTHFVRLREG
jgi:6-pyruvoyl-tetrahydropterin synthase